MSGANVRKQGPEPRDVRVRSGSVTLDGLLRVPAEPVGLVVFAHGSGSSRLSRRNNFVADVLAENEVASLLFDLLTAEEEGADQYSRELRFDIDLLTDRLIGATEWVHTEPATAEHPVGYFGASTGAAAALGAAAHFGASIRAVVSRGGRPDLAMGALPEVESPTLLIVGGADRPVIGMNREACDRLTCEKEMGIVEGASHLFEEPGALEEVARLATEWFRRHLSPPDRTGAADG